MTDTFDPYVVLGVPRSASDEDIKAAYRTAAAKAHPDRAGGSTEAMTDVNMAYKILSDPAMRANFDQTGSTKREVPLDTKARELMVKLLGQIIRGSSPFDDMLGILRSGLAGQLAGCKAARQKTLKDLSDLRLRLSRLKGPADNFIESLLLLEISRGEQALPVYDADELVIARSIDMLGEFSYGGQVLMSQTFDPNRWPGLLGNGS